MVTSATINLAWSEVATYNSVQSFCSQHGIEWHFIVEYSPWMGGFCERLVGVVKTALRKTISRALLTSSQLTTILYEIETTINSRPLVYGDEEPKKS